MNNIVSASILSADMLNLSESIYNIEKSGAKWLHFDVMDGVFVKNISFGFPVFEAVSKSTDLFLDVHLMITNPAEYAFKFAKLGADMVTFHAESCDNIESVINGIKSCGAKAGIAIKPSTPVETAIEYAAIVDMILVMTVEPGFGGQKFIMHTAEKIKALREYINHNKLSTDIQVDGGINCDTSKIARKAGANILVAGNYLFKADNMANAVKSLIS